MTSEEAELLAKTAEAIFADRCGAEVLDEADRAIWASELWQTLDHAGLTLLGVPEEKGGSGGTLCDAAVVVRIAGRYCTPVPIADHCMLAAWALAVAGITIPDDSVLAFIPPSRSTTIVRNRPDGGWKVSASARSVPWGRIATHAVVVGQHGGLDHVALLTRSQFRVTHGSGLSGEPADDVHVTEVAVDSELVRPLPAIARSDRCRARAALSRALLITGALERVLIQCLDHVRERHQFGRPLASFQVIQHDIATLVGEVAAATASADLALAAAGTADEVRYAGMAKVRTGDAATRCARIAHQIHGAIGFTDEHRLRHATRRLWAWRDEHGGETEWAEIVGRDLSQLGTERFWDRLSSP